MKDIKSLLLILLSTGLVATWVYHLYDKTQYGKRMKEIYIKDSAAVAEGIRDSLQKIYNEALQDLDENRTSADSLKGQLDNRLAEINKLRYEISAILKKRDFSDTDLKKARDLIRDLRRRIDELKAENNSLAAERKRLTGVLDQLNKEMEGLQQSVQKISAENSELAKKISEASTFIASEIRLSAINIRSGQREVETTQLKKADKFVASFVVQNNIAGFENAELVLVLTGPDGKTIMSDVWDSGTFDTRTEGKRNFTRKMKFEYTRGEQKKLIFSIEPDKFSKGTYSMDIYHNGVKIGEVSKTLS